MMMTVDLTLRASYFTTPHRTDASHTEHAHKAARESASSSEYNEHNHAVVETHLLRTCTVPIEQPAWTPEAYDVPRRLTATTIHYLILSLGTRLRENGFSILFRRKVDSSHVDS
jgi:hypothetical protein